MNSEFYEALTLLEKEKDIKKEYMLEKITAAIIAAVKKEKNMDMRQENIASFFDEEKKTVRFFSAQRGRGKRGKPADGNRPRLCKKNK